MSKSNITNVSAELALLNHTKQNQALHRLPPSATVQRRPLNHAPVASVFAGSSVQKVVYVSRKTPVMAAVKRVKKLLGHVDRRVVQAGVAKGTNSSTSNTGRRLDSEKGVDPDKGMKEEVLVKASGRAMEQALRVADWFRSREDEMLCEVVVRTGSVAAVDDIVVDEVDEVEDFGHDGKKDDNDDSRLDETTITTTTITTTTTTTTQQPDGSGNTEAGEKTSDPGGNGKRKRKRKRRPVYDKDELPEARIRWVKTVEVAISLKS